MHGGCQFGIFANSLVLQCLTVLIREAVTRGVSNGEQSQQSEPWFRLINRNIEAVQNWSAVY
jgi:hypothetical protein